MQYSAAQRLIRLLGFVVAMLMMIMGANTRTTTVQAVSCNDVMKGLAPCAGFLSQGGAKPASGSACCKGVKALNGMANSQQARQQICSCLIAAAKSFKPKPSSVTALPAACGVAFPYSFSTTQNCRNIR